MNTNTLEEFIEAVNATDIPRTIETGEALASELETRSDSLQATKTALTTSVLDSNPSTEEVKVTNQLSDALQNAKQSRVEMNMGLLQLAMGTFNQSDLLSRAEKVETAHKKVEDLEKEFQTTEVAKGLRPITHITAPDEVRVQKPTERSGLKKSKGKQKKNKKSSQRGSSAKGKSAETKSGDGSAVKFEAIISNGGGTTMQDVSISSKTELKINPTRTSVATIDSFESKSVAFNIDVNDAAGRYSVRVSADPDNADRDTTIVPVYVLSVDEYLQEGAEILATFKSDLEEVRNEVKKSIRPLLQNLSKLQSNLSELVTSIQEDQINKSSINGRIQSLRGQLQKFYGLLNAYKSLSDARKGAFINSLDTVDEKLEQAQGAGV